MNKNLRFLSFVLFATITIVAGVSNNIYSQCGLSGYNSGGVGNPPCGSFAAISGGVGSGTYGTFNCVNGANYTISTCGSSFNTQISGYNGGTNGFIAGFYNDDNGPDCGGTPASYNWTATFTGSVKVMVNQFNCVGWVNGGASAVLKFRQNSPTITSSNATMCSGQTRTLTANQAGGTWSGTGVSGNTFTAPVAAGNYTITYTLGNCAPTQTITVNSNSAAPTSVGTTLNPICPGQSTTLSVSGGSLGSGAAWNWYSGSCGGTFLGTGTTITVTPAGTTTYFVRAAGTCNTTACASVTVTVQSNSSVSSAAASPTTICVGQSSTLSVTGTLGTGATWNWYTGSCGGTLVGQGQSISVSPSSSTTYYVRAVGTCNTTVCASTAVSVNPLPGVAFAPPGGPFCASQTTPVTLSGAPGGGTFSGNGVTGNQFIPANAAVGNNILTYTYTDGNGCTNSAQQTVVIIGLPVVTFTGLAGPYCVSQTTTVPLDGNQNGGTYSGPGITNLGSGNASFNPSTAGAGVHSITYTYTDGNGCTNSQTQSVQVVALPAVTFSGLAASYCANNSPVQLTGFPSGGIFSGTPAVTSGGLFSPSTGAGNYTITYTYTNSNGCTNSTSQSTVVNSVPVVSYSGFNVPHQYCLNSAVVNLTGSPAGGTFSGPGVTGSGAFTPSTAGLGTHTITYTYTNGNNCTNTSSQTVTVVAVPTVTFSGLAGPYCISQTTPVLLTGSPSGGTFSGPGITDLGGGTANFTPSVALVGTHNITYTYTNGVGCTNSQAQSVQVVTLPSVTFSGLASSYCVSNSPVQLTGFPSGGTFSGTGVTSGGLFSPSTGTGNYTITYTYTDGNSCTNSASQSTVVNPLPVVSFSGFNIPHQYCLNAAVVSLTGSPTGGTFSGPGVTSGGVFTPSTAGLGTHTIVYTYTNGNNCTNTSSQTVTVVSVPTVSFTGLAGDYCVNDFPVLLTGNQSSGTFSGPGITNTGPGLAEFNPTTAGVGGSYNITYTYSDVNGCSGSQTQQTVVHPQPVIAFSGLSSEYCVDANPVILTGSHAPGGSFAGTGTTDNGNGTATFNAAVAGVGGPYTITYTYSDGFGCSNSISNTTLVNDTPTVSYTGLQDICIDQGALILTGTPSGGVFSGPGVSGNAFYPGVAGLGVHTVVYTYSDGNGCVGAYSDSLRVYDFPQVTQQPTDVQVCPGDNASFIVNAVGVGLTYQWQVNDGNGFVNVNNVGIYSGATTNTLTLTSVPPSYDGYQYNCVITGATCLTVTNSTTVTITENPSPTIYTQPADYAACVGDNAVFSINASGTSLTYQWQVDDGSGFTNVVNGGVYGGATTNTLSITGFTSGMDGYLYRCIVTGTVNCTSNSISNVAVLTETTSPNITTQPVSQSICEGDNAVFTVAATGTGLTYQWQEDSGSGFANISNGGAYSGATSAILTVSGVTSVMDGNQYQCIISGSICVNSSTSTAVLLNITTSPAISQQPADAYVCPSDPASFSVTVQGTGITYQWQVNNGGGFINIINSGVYTGATTATLNISGTLVNMDGFQYRCIVNGIFCSGTSTSQIATIYLSGAPSISQGPTDTQFCDGDIAVFSVSATGTGLSYQWQVNDGSGWADLVNGISYNGVYTSVLTISPATLSMDGNLYRCIVSGTINCFGVATSNAASLTENPAPFISTQPADEYICDGGNAVFSVTATGTGLSYQWQENTGSGFVNVVNGGPYSGANSSALTITGVTSGMDGYQYQCLINGTICTATATTTIVTLHFATAPTVTLQPADIQVCPGDAAVFTVAASGSNLSYQWEEDSGSGFNALINGGVYSGATSATLTISPTSTGMNGNLYRCVISSTDCSNNSFSNIVTLNVNTSPVIVSAPVDVYACPGDPVTFDVTANGFGLTYQWQENTGSGFTNLSDGLIYVGTHSPSLTILFVGSWMANFEYRVIVTGSINCSQPATSTIGVIHLNTSPVITTQPADQNFCAGDVASFSVAAVGTSLTYQWQVDDGSGFADVVDGGVYSGATTSTLSLSGIPVGMDGYQYQCVVSGSSNCASSVTTVVVTLNEDPNPFISSQPVDQYVCVGDIAVFSVSASGTGLVYQWQQDSGGGFTILSDGGIYSGSSTSTLTLTGITSGMDGYTYRCVITGSICTGTSVTNVVTLHETTSPYISVQPQDQSVCDGDNVTLNVTANGTGLTYQWQVNNGSGFVNITDGILYSGSTTGTLNILGATLSMNNYTYQCIVSGTICTSSSTSNAALLNVGQGPMIVLGPSNQTLCDGGNASFTVTTSGNVNNYQWQVDDGSGYVSIANGGIYSNANTATLNITGATASMNGYQYQCIVVGSINCNVNSTSPSAVLLVNALPVVNFSGLNTEYCVDAALATLTGVPAGGTFSGPGMIGNDFSASTAGVGGPYTITYTYTDGNSCTNSTTQTVSVNALPVVSYTGLAGPYCINDNTPVTLTGTPVGGTFSGPGISGNVFTPSNASLGTVSITYTYTDGNTCTNFETQSAIVNDIPALTLTGTNPAYCADDNTPVTLIGTPAGGTFSGTGVTGNTWTASDAGVGTHVITYTYTDGNNCSNSTTISVVVNGLPAVDFTGLALSYCVDDAAVTLTGIPANGTFSGNGMNVNDFDPALAGVGGHTVTYTYTDVNGCVNTANHSTTVNALPTPVISPSTIAFCNGDYGILDAGTGYTLYNWSTGFNGQQTLVDSAGQVTVTVTDVNGCINTSAPATVVVYALPVVDLGPDTTICTQSTYTLDAGFPGSTYDWSTNATTQTITVGSTGVYAVTLVDQHGCEGFDYALVTVSQTLAPTITSSGLTTFCQGDSIILDAGSGYSTYLWSDGITTTQTLTVYQPGFYQVFVTNSLGCDGFSAPVIVTVLQNPSPAISADGPLSFCPGQDVVLNAGFGYNAFQWQPGLENTQTITVTQAGQYSVTVTASNGCSGSSAPVTVTVFPIPSPVIEADGPLQFCHGEDVVLSLTQNFASYLWTSGSVTPEITVTESGQYGVIVMDMNGCIDSTLVANPVTVTVWQPIPVISESGDTLTCSPAFSTYQWYENDTMVTIPGGNSQQLITQSSGNYTVVVTDANGCTGESNIIEHSQTGIEDLDLNAMISIYPNPTNGVFTFGAEFETQEDIRLELTNALGQLIIPVEDVENVKSLKRDYNLNHLPDGVYVLMIHTNKGNVARRIVKN